MAQFASFIDITTAYITIQGNGTPVAQEPILNFVGADFTVTDDPTNFRTNVILPSMVHLAGSTMTGALILSGDPVTGLQAATKEYVDSLSAGLSPRTSCRAATTTALTVTYNNGTSGVGATLTNAGSQTALVLDGVTMAVADRVLVKDQVSTFQNGIYTVTNIGSNSTNWVMTRATDYNTAASNGVVEGSYTVISEGTVNAANLYVETGQGPFTIGTTPIIFSAFNSAANISVTAPITKTGNVIALTTPLAGTYGGTGINNGSNTITIGGNILTAGAFTTSGANPLTFTTTGSTSVTLPISGTLVNTAVTTLSSLVSIGTITTGTWNGTLIGSTYGGTGVNNGSSTITLGGNLTTLGSFGSTFTMTNTTAVTFPTSGTLATTSQLPSLPLSLANGGTNASLTASNGGIFYSSGSAGAILSGTATANQVLLSGSSTTPAWSTATYPATTTANQILYSSSGNAIAGLATGNNGVLITSGAGAPSISSTLPSAVQGNITTVGTIGTGIWQGTVIAGQYGGTGVANTGSTITLGGSVTYSGAHTTTWTTSGNTTLTLPTSGTVMVGSNNLSDVSSTATSRSNLGVDVCFYQITSQIFTTSGTYTPTSGMVYCIIEAVGGGGAGGNSGTTNSTSVSSAAGGGGGGYSRKICTAATIGASQTVTIGAGGTIGSGSGVSGNAGGNTTVGSLLQGGGGNGGGGSNGGTLEFATGGAGGTANSGDVNVYGQPGANGLSIYLIAGTWSSGGSGGNSVLGGGGLGSVIGSGTAAGAAGSQYGGGGSGAAGSISSSNVNGAAGAPGVVIITEFIERS